MNVSGHILKRSQVGFGWLAGSLIILGTVALTAKVAGDVRDNHLWFILSAFVPGASLGLVLIATAERIRLGDSASLGWARIAALLSVMASIALAVRVLIDQRTATINRPLPVDPFWAAVTALVALVPIALAILLILQAMPSPRRLGSASPWGGITGLVIVIASLSLGLKWALDPEALSRFPVGNPAGELRRFLDNATVPICLGLLLAVAALPQQLFRRHPWALLAAGLMTLASILWGFEIADQAPSEKVTVFFFVTILPLELALLAVLITQNLRPPLAAPLVASAVIVNMWLSVEILTQSGGEIGRLWLFLIFMLQPAGFAALCLLCLDLTSRQPPRDALRVYEGDRNDEPDRPGS